MTLAEWEASPYKKFSERFEFSEGAILINGDGNAYITRCDTEFDRQSVKQIEEFSSHKLIIVTITPNYNDWLNRYHLPLTSKQTGELLNLRGQTKLW